MKILKSIAEKLLQLVKKGDFYNNGNIKIYGIDTITMKTASDFEKYWLKKFDKKFTEVIQDVKQIYDIANENNYYKLSLFNKDFALYMEIYFDNNLKELVINYSTFPNVNCPIYKKTVNNYIELFKHIMNLIPEDQLINLMLDIDIESTIYTFCTVSKLADIRKHRINEVSKYFYDFEQAIEYAMENSYITVNYNNIPLEYYIFGLLIRIVKLIKENNIIKNDNIINFYDTLFDNKNVPLDNAFSILSSSEKIYVTRIINDENVFLNHFDIKFVYIFHVLSELEKFDNNRVINTYFIKTNDIQVIFNQDNRTFYVTYSPKDRKLKNYPAQLVKEKDGNILIGLLKENHKDGIYYMLKPFYDKLYTINISKIPSSRFKKCFKSEGSI